MRSETESSDYRESLDEWSPLLAQHLALGKHLAKTEPYRETIVRKVPAQTPPVPPAPKQQQQRGARRRSWHGYGARAHRDNEE